MAAVPARRPVTLVGQIIALLVALNRPRDGRKAKARALWLAAACKEHVTTVVALAAIDLGAFQASRIAGFIVLGACLLLAEWKIRGLCGMKTAWALAWIFWVPWFLAWELTALFTGHASLTLSEYVWRLEEINRGWTFLRYFVAVFCLWLFFHMAFGWLR